MAFRILMHALRMISTNLGDAIKLTLLLTVVGQVLVLYMTQNFFGANVQAFDPTAMPDVNMEFALPYLFSVLVQFGLSAWVAVGWHRFVLEQEYPTGFIPRLYTSFVLGYIGRLFLISLLMVLAAVPLSLMIGVFASVGQNLGAFLGIFLMIITLIWLSLRLSLVLPAISVGRRMTISESWAASKPLSLDIFGLAALLVVVGGLVSLIPTSGALGLVISVITGWFSIIIGASVLTTIYGILIEGREIK